MKILMLVTMFAFVMAGLPTHAEDECKTVEGPSAGSKCKFPFIFESQRYDKCTKVGEIGTFWCATEIDDSGEMIPEKWGICAYYCDIYEPVDCVWGDYGKWSACSKSCGGGEKTRSRAKATEKVNGGHECLGEASETESCNEDACPDLVKYHDAETTLWCKESKPIEGRNGCMNDADCLENARSQCDNDPKCYGVSWYQNTKWHKMRLCLSEKMEPKTDGWRTMMKSSKVLTSTTTTTAASTTTGSESGFKGCLSGFNLLVPKTIGEFAACVDENLRKLFGMVEVDCVWDEWEIGECSKSCGGGNRTNVRIPKVEAKHGGEECQGESETTEECNTLQCPECTSHRDCASSSKNYCYSNKCFENACDIRPCRNGGSCKDRIWKGTRMYDCTCPTCKRGKTCWKGSRCETAYGLNDDDY